MTEDERQYLLRAVSETHASLSEVALKLRLELPPKAPALAEGWFSDTDSPALDTVAAL